MPDGTISVSGIDKFGIGLELKKFKEGNSINYPALFAIPTDQRIAAMAKKDLGQTITIIAVAITLAMETMNVKRGMNNFQILDLAEAIVDEAESDQLSIEDLLLFFQKLTRGEYPDLYEGVDQAKILSRFSDYRDERWEAGIKIRDAKVAEYKELGGVNTFERENPKDGSPFGQYMQHFRQKSMERKDEKIESKRYK